MKRLLIVLLIVLLIAGAVFLIIWPFGTDSGEKNENQRGTSETNVEVYIARPVSQSRQVNFTGRILPYNQIDIYAERAGVLDYLLYEEGITVKKGDLIFSLVNNDLKARVENLDVQIDVTSKKIERKEKLFEREGISKEELEVEKANLSSLEAQKAQIQEELRKTRGIAPFDGIIGLRQKSNGAYVSSGDLITSLTASKKLIIEFDIPSKYAQIIKEGDSIFCAIEGIGVISSTIYSLSPSIDPETQTLEARALYSNSKGVIPGSYAKIRLNVTEKDNALMIPTQAVIPKLNGQELYVVRNGKAEKLDVMTGIRTASMIEITEGIANGDSVIISGLLQVKPGAELKISAVNE